jgi:hypothetical protein
MVKTSSANVQDSVVRATRCQGYVDPCFSFLLMHLTLTCQFIISNTSEVHLVFTRLVVFLRSVKLNRLAAIHSWEY